MKQPLLRTGPANLIGLFLMAACNGDGPVAPTKPAASPATPLSTWVSPQPCQIGLPYNGSGYFYTLMPIGSSACGVGWSMYFPPNSDAYRGIYWYDDDPATPFYTLFSSGYYYAAWGLYGPIELTFNSAVKNFSLVVESKERTFFPEYTVFPLRSGTYMVALDAAGQRLDSVSFDANVMVSEKSFQISGIKKILIYPVIKRYDGAAPIPDDMVYRASFATMPPGELTCKSPTGTSTVTRGATVTCIVTGAGVVVTGWTFTGPSYENPNTILRVTGAGGSNSWIGTAIASGDVAAQITVNGVPSAPLTSSFTVQPRTGSAWSWGPNLHWKFTQGTGKNCGYGTMEYFDSTRIGWNRRTGVCTPGALTPYAWEDSTRGYTVKAPTSGPNKNIWYVSALTYQLLRESQINQAITPTSKLIYALVDASEKAECSANAGTTITKANFYFFNATCKRLDVAGFIAGVWRHEGYGTNNNGGHQAQFELAASMPEYNLYNKGEAVYAITQADARSIVVAIARFVDNNLALIGARESTVAGKNWGGDLFLWAASLKRFVSNHFAP